MPAAIQVVTHILPARYYMAIIRNVFLKGSALTLLWRDLFSLALFAVILVLLATRAFKKKLT